MSSSPDNRVWRGALTGFGSEADGKHVKKAGFVLQATDDGAVWDTLSADTYRILKRAGDVEIRPVDDDGNAVDITAYTDWQDAGNQAFRVTYTVTDNGTETTYPDAALTLYEMIVYPGSGEIDPLVESADVGIGAITSKRIDTSIQSDNFVSGSSGWKIWRNSGNAEFNNITARGTVYADAGEIAHWNIGVINANTISSDNGNMRFVSGANPYFSGGNNAPTSYMSNVGFWLGRDAGDTETPKRYKFHIGDPNGQVLYWDGANLYDTGQKISGGKIGKWKISGLKIKATNDDIVLDADVPSIAMGSSADAMDYLSGTGYWVGKHSGAYKFHLGNPAGQVLYWDGANLYDSGQKIDGGKIGKWKISGLKIKATNDDIVLDADVPSIQLNTALVSGGTLSGSGFWVGKDTAYKLFVGNAAGAYLFWNGSKLIKKGVKHKGTNELGDSDEGVQDTDLLVVYGHIQSDDWVSGTSGAGWRISNSGNANFRNVTVRGELHASVFVADMIEAKAGTMIVAKSAGKLSADKTIPASGTWTITIKNPPSGNAWLFDNNDICQIKDVSSSGSVQSYWFSVQRGAFDGGGGQTYTCTHLHGTRGVTFPKGGVVVDFGVGGQGWLEMSAQGTGAPYYSVRTHAGAPYTTVTERGRFGNMNGAFGISGNYYGFGIGDYVVGNYIRYDSNNGLLMTSASGALTIDATSGINIIATTTPQNVRAYTFSNASGIYGGLYSYLGSGYNNLSLDNYAQSGKETETSIFTDAPTGYRSEIRLEVFQNSAFKAKFQLWADAAGNASAVFHGVGLMWATDNAYDIGSSGTYRPRDVYIGRNAVVTGEVQFPQGRARAEQISIYNSSWTNIDSGSDQRGLWIFSIGDQSSVWYSFGNSGAGLALTKIGGNAGHVAGAPAGSWDVGFQVASSRIQAKAGSSFGNPSWLKVVRIST